MTSQARAAIYPAPNQPFEIRDFPLRNVSDEELLVRVSMSSICRSDIHSYHGHRPNPCPGILGHEIIGVIDQLGAHIQRDLRGDALAVGDRVTWTEYFHHGKSYYRDVHDMPQKSDGIRKYGHDLADEDPHFLGGFADYCYIMPGTGLLQLPDSLPADPAMSAKQCSCRRDLRNAGRYYLLQASWLNHDFLQKTLLCLQNNTKQQK